MKLLKANVLSVDRIHVCILCPICGQVHLHGSNGIIDDDNYGTRVPHCGQITLPWRQGRYWVERRGLQYELVCTPQTQRCEAGASRWANSWYKQHLAKAHQKARRELSSEARQAAKSRYGGAGDIQQFVASALKRESMAERTMRFASLEGEVGA